MRGTAVQKWEVPTATETRQEKQRRVKAAWLAVCKLVNQRDGYRCRVCGRELYSGIRHHHHIVFRSKGRDDSPGNLALLCPLHHAEVHSGKLRIEGDADRTLAIYRRDDDSRWFLSRQEIGIRKYVTVD